MLNARAVKYNLNFKKPAGTSRGVLTQKETWFIELYNSEHPERKALGECGILRGLSADDVPEYEQKIRETVKRINAPREELDAELKEFPSIRAGLEAAFLDLDNGCEQKYFPSDFTCGKQSIAINGLIWMGSKESMLEQISSKIKAGFNCIKMKIGAVDFEHELECIRYIRERYSADKIEIRTDANGAFSPEDAPYKLEKLAQMDVHSIEQPLKAGRIIALRELCAKNLLPIALDEELIGVWDPIEKQELLDAINPHYIILKPSLTGGFTASKEWIDAADQRGIGFWITSALESNIGLNAIAQWTANTADNDFPQGLGTGGLYTNNIAGPTYIQNGRLHYNTDFEFQNPLS